MCLDMSVANTLTKEHNTLLYQQHISLAGNPKRLHIDKKTKKSQVLHLDSRLKQKCSWKTSFRIMYALTECLLRMPGASSSSSQRILYVIQKHWWKTIAKPQDLTIKHKALTPQRLSGKNKLHDRPLYASLRAQGRGGRWDLDYILLFPTES